jgi:hypothetical protein
LTSGIPETCGPRKVGVVGENGWLDALLTKASTIKAIPEV